MTPTPEQMQEFKDFFLNYLRSNYPAKNGDIGLADDELIGKVKLEDSYQMFNAWHQHCLMNDHGFLSNAELKRKLAALQEEHERITKNQQDSISNYLKRIDDLQQQLDASQDTVRMDTAMLLSLQSECDDLRQQLTASQERCKELEQGLCTALNNVNNETFVRGMLDLYKPNHTNP